MKKRVEKRGKEDESNVEIIVSSKKRIAFKSKTISKKKIANVKVEDDGDGDGARVWFDLEVLQLITFCGEMDVEFVKNEKNQRIF